MEGVEVREYLALAALVWFMKQQATTVAASLKEVTAVLARVDATTQDTRGDVKEMARRSA